jgi:thioredoxin reductase (NADPH)
VNVGCIPKKLFHISTQVKESVQMAEDYGWGQQSDPLENNWEALRTNIQNYIKGINFGYKKKLKEIGVDFVESRAKFKDQHTVEFEFGKQGHELRAKSFVIATGVRPRQYEALPELKKWAITSDDLFSLKENPGKTLVIGGGYIAVECAGFLRGLGNEVILANRSSILRVFDGDMAHKVIDQLEEEGIQIMTGSTIKSVIKLGERDFEVEIQTKNGDKVKVEKQRVNTILMAIGRDPNPSSYAAEKAGIRLD